MSNKRTFTMSFRMLGLLILLQSVTIAASPPGIPDGWSDGYVYANGIRFHYYHAVPAPGKPVIVMAHGITDNGLCWTTLTCKLQNSYDIYMVDTRGHGLSDPFTASDDGDTLVKDVIAFVQAMDFEKPILMGHSMGAATVMRVGAEYPELAKAIIMLDPPGLGRGGPRGRSGHAPEAASPNQRRERTSKATAEGERHLTPLETPKRESSGSNNRLSVNMFGDPETLVKQNNYSFEDLVTTGRRQNPKWDIVDIQYWALSKKQYHGAYTNQAWQAMSGTMKVADSLAKIPVPAIILKADASPEERQFNLQRANVMQKGKLVHIDGAAHNLHHDELEHTAEVLIGFLSSLSE